MELQGTVQNGVIVLQSGNPLPEGTRVTIIVDIKGKTEVPTKLKDRLLKLAGTVDDLPRDMARNHDHYLHGAPKR